MIAKENTNLVFVCMARGLRYGQRPRARGRRCKGSGIDLLYLTPAASKSHAQFPAVRKIRPAVNSWFFNDLRSYAGRESGPRARPQAALLHSCYPTPGDPQLQWEPAAPERARG